MPKPTRIAELASIISTQTAVVDEYLESHGLDSPTFDLNYVDPPQLPSDIAAAKRAIYEATEELNSLILGPMGFLSIIDSTFIPTLHAIYRFNLATSFPIEAEASFAEIATKVGVPEADVQRIIRTAITHRIFLEPRKGFVAHNAISKLIATTPVVHSWLGVLTDEIWPASTRIVDAIEKWPDSQEGAETGHNLVSNSPDAYFDGLKKDPFREKRFADMMTFFHAGRLEGAGLIEYYDWDSIGEGTVVELGGSKGAMCFELAKSYPKIKWISQDLPEVIKDVEVPEEVKGRVELMAHDFFTEQPIKNADAYLLRWIFHDWSDKYSIRILRNLIPALKHGARILIGEVCVPDPGQVSCMTEREMRMADMVMKATLNGKERSAEQWAQLFVDSDPRFKFQGVLLVPNSRWSIMQAVWEDVPSQS